MVFQKPSLSLVPVFSIRITASCWFSLVTLILASILVGILMTGGWNVFSLRNYFTRREDHPLTQPPAWWTRDLSSMLPPRNGDLQQLMKPFWSGFCHQCCLPQNGDLPQLMKPFCLGYFMSFPLLHFLSWFASGAFDFPRSSTRSAVISPLDRNEVCSHQITLYPHIVDLGA